jgi:hypothetical protein
VRDSCALTWGIQFSALRQENSEEGTAFQAKNAALRENSAMENQARRMLEEGTALAAHAAALQDEAASQQKRVAKVEQEGRQDQLVRSGSYLFMRCSQSGKAHSNMSQISSTVCHKESKKFGTGGIVITGIRRGDRQRTGRQGASC